MKEKINCLLTPSLQVLFYSNVYNNCSKLRPPTVIHAWQRPWSDWRTISKMPDISRTRAAATDIRATRSSTESTGFS